MTNMNERFLIWSFEHGSWWRPGSAGYTEDKSEAGIYSYQEALRIVLEANRYLPEDEPIPNEAMVPISISDEE